MHGMQLQVQGCASLRNFGFDLDNRVKIDAAYCHLPPVGFTLGGERMRYKKIYRT